MRSTASRLYLVVYNSLQAFGWGIGLLRILFDFVSTRSVAGTYASSGEQICLLQSLAFLEVVHGALAIVPSGVLFPLMQWGGRTHFLLAIVRNLEEVQRFPSVFVTFVAWSLSEIIRYSHYSLNCISCCPSWVTYIRYTAFILLYPIGLFLGEMWLMYEALPHVQRSNLYADSFASLPFSYYHFLRALFVCYPFLWLSLYIHMFKQRRSKLRIKEGKNKKI